MNRSRLMYAIVPVAAAALLGACAYMGASGSGNPMSFFVTSANPGKGADLGGLAGADGHCQALASAAGAGGKTWHAYLSATASASSPAVNARDRIGRGPWQNAKGVVIAKSVEELHGTNNLNKETALTEKGDVIPGSGDPGTSHDMLTGSTSDGRAPTGDNDVTCHNWTSSNEGSAIVGHHDRRGTAGDRTSWNASHPTPGCSPEALKRVGGAGLLYCFAVN